MENASKALVMAGTILIALIIISALILSYNNFSNYEKFKDGAKDEKKLLEFNNQYASYYRSDVRGSELISLTNKIIEHNSKCEDTGLEEISLKIDLKGKNDLFSYYTDKNELELIPENENIDNVDSIKSVISSAKVIEKNCQGETACFNLVSNISNIIGEEVTDEDALEKINSIIRTKIDEDELEDYKKNIKKYYEYTQFKRGKFNSADITYNNQGIINSLSFEFTGKFN